MTEEYGYLGHVYDIQPFPDDDEHVLVTSPRVVTEETEALTTGLNAYADMGKYGYKTRVQAFNYDFFLPVGNVEAFTERVAMIGGIILDEKPDMDAMGAAYEQATARMTTLSQAREWLERIARDPIPDDEAKREVLTLLYGFREELKRIAIPDDFNRIQKDIEAAAFVDERQQMQKRIQELEQKTVGVRKLNLN